MAMGRPVISTRQGAEGLDVTHGSNILLADTPVEFAQHIFSLFGSPQLRERLATAGRQLVEKKYRWSICFDKLEDFYQALHSKTQVPSEATEVYSYNRKQCQ